MTVERDELPELDHNPHWGNDRGKIAAGRRMGASPEEAARMAAANARLEWSGTCRLCGRHFRGRPDQLAGHRCGDA